MVRKAQFGFDSMLGYLTFGVFLLLTIIVLSLGGCAKNKRTVAGLEIDDAVQAEITELRASQQLLGYLRTNMLDLTQLNLKIDTLNEELTGKDSTEIDKESVKNFLKEHPETHVGKTYGEFISALSAYVKADETKGIVNDVFDAVTKATFSRNLFAKSERDAYSGLDAFFSPILIVKYSSGPELITKIDIITLHDKTFITKILPTGENSRAKVQMYIYGDDDSLPAP